VQVPRGPIRFGPDFSRREPSLAQHPVASHPVTVNVGSVRVGTTGAVVVGVGAGVGLVTVGRAGDTGATVIGVCMVRCDGGGPVVPPPRQMRAARSRMASSAAGDGPAAEAGCWTLFAVSAADSWACTAASACRHAGDWVVSAMAAGIGAGEGVWAWHQGAVSAQASHSSRW